MSRIVNLTLHKHYVFLPFLFSNSSHLPPPGLTHSSPDFALQAIGWVVGFIYGDFKLTVMGWAAGVGISILLVVPDWPWFNQHPTKWLDSLPPRKGVKPVGAAADAVKQD
ncbi:unnamed protein product [Choristocarpus tenellus]